jgi:hypothetical protein
MLAHEQSGINGTVYVDRLQLAVARDAATFRAGRRHRHMWCHMWSDDIDALHALAAAVGMKRTWFQDKPGFPHYDLVPTRRTAALRLGAVEMSLKVYLRRRRMAAAA